MGKLIEYLKYLKWGGWKSLNLKSVLLTLRLKKCGIGLIVKRGVKINEPSKVKIGNFCCLDSYSSIFTNKINNNTPTVILGDNVLIGSFSSIGASNKIIIQDNVMLVPHVHITDRNHSFEDINIPIRLQPSISSGPVIIGESSWLGYGCQVMPNVTIGKHCVVAAGAIVTKSIPDFCVVAGAPAQIIKRYNFKSNRWEKVQKQV